MHFNAKLLTVPFYAFVDVGKTYRRKEEGVDMWAAVWTGNFLLGAKIQQLLPLLTWGDVG